MQEIALLLSSLAGIATAAAVRARAGYHGRGRLLTLGASSQIQIQIKTLRMEKDILARSITRLYQSEEWDAMPRQYKEGLLAKYQHQLGVVMARLEKLEDAKKHPDLGPVGDGLITLMDQKMTGLDTKMYDMASDIADIKAVQRESKDVRAEQAAAAKEKAEPPRVAEAGADAVAAATARAAKTEAAMAETVKAAKAVAVTATAPRMEPERLVPTPRSVGSFEIATLTSITARKPRFPNLGDAASKKHTAEAEHAGMAEAAADHAELQEQKLQPHAVAEATRQQPKRSISIKPDTKEIRQTIHTEPPVAVVPSPHTQHVAPPTAPPTAPPIAPPVAPPTAPGPTAPPIAPPVAPPVAPPTAPGPTAPPVAPPTAPPATTTTTPTPQPIDLEDSSMDDEDAEMKEIIKNVNKILDKINRAESE